MTKQTKRIDIIIPWIQIEQIITNIFSHCLFDLLVCWFVDLLVCWFISFKGFLIVLVNTITKISLFKE